jgi:hypothetical protein
MKRFRPDWQSNYRIKQKEAECHRDKLNHQSREAERDLQRRELLERIKRISDQADAKAQAQQAEWDRYNRREWRRFILETIGVTAAVIAAIFFYCQLQAMLEANGDNRFALIQSQRAWVFLKGLSYKTLYLDSTTQLLGISLTPIFMNDGNTPAFSVGCSAKFEPTETLVKSDYLEDITPSDVGPRGEIDCPTHIITTAEMSAIRNKKARYFIGIHIKYRDVFNGTPPRYTYLCFEFMVMTDPTLPHRGQLAAPEEISFTPVGGCNSAS